MQYRALLMAAVLMFGGFGSVFADMGGYHGGNGHEGNGHGTPDEELGDFCGTFNDTFISLDLHPAGGLPGDKTNVTVIADYNASGRNMPRHIFEWMYSYVTFAWYRPSTHSWISAWYNPADDPELDDPVNPRPIPRNPLITNWNNGVGSATVNKFPVPNISVNNLLPGEEIWLVACFAHPMDDDRGMDMNYTVAPYQVSICHTERDRVVEIIAPSQGLPGEEIDVTVKVHLNAGDRPRGWELIRLAWIDSTGNVIGPHVDVPGILIEGTLDDTGRLTTPGIITATGTLTVPNLPQGTHLTLLACTGHPMGAMYDGTNGYHSLDFEVLGFMVVPEMIIGSIGLIGAALGSFMLYARRKQA